MHIRQEITVEFRPDEVEFRGSKTILLEPYLFLTPQLQPKAVIGKGADQDRLSHFKRIQIYEETTESQKIRILKFFIEFGVGEVHGYSLLKPRVIAKAEVDCQVMDKIELYLADAGVDEVQVIY